MSLLKLNHIACIAGCIFLIGCSSNHNATSTSLANSHPPVNSPRLSPTTSSPSPVPTAEPDPIQEQLAQMTLDEKIGQMIIIGVDGTAVSEQTKALIEQFHVGGVILYQNNISNKLQTTDFLNELKQINTKSNPIPLWLSVDEEGGRVSRMPSEYAKLPTNRRIGKINSAEFSYKLGTILGKELQSLGFNMNFAPVLDINNNPNNPVIGDRSFGDNAEVVSNLGVQTMLGIQAQKVAAVVKHFPGHGDTAVDSHLDLPVVQTELKRLRTFEWLPFQAAIKQHVDAVMIAHILLPKLDPDNPASFSKIIITDYLRKELHYNGVVMTDDMTMGGVVNHYQLKDAAFQAVEAGNDVIMVAHDYDKAKEVLLNLRNQVKSGALTEQRIDQSVYRILQLKMKYTIQDTDVHSVDITVINNEIKSLLNQYMK